MASINKKNKHEFKQVEYLNTPLTRIDIILKVGGKKRWDDWPERIGLLEDNWKETQKEFKLKGSYGRSMKLRDLEMNDDIQIMYWFEHPDDAMIFKLTNNGVN